MPLREALLYTGEQLMPNTPRIPRIINDDEGALVVTGKPGTLVLSKLESPLRIKNFLSPSH